MFHLSTKSESELFSNNEPLENKKITCEVCIHHLSFNDDDYKTINVITRKKVNVKSKKIKNYIIDFSNPEDYKKVIKKGDVTQTQKNILRNRHKKCNLEQLLPIWDFLGS